MTEDWLTLSVDGVFMVPEEGRNEPSDGAGA